MPNDEQRECRLSANALTPFMWTWPLDSATEATAAHKASEGVTDGTFTQVWAWMTNKCRKMMGQKKKMIYNIRDLPQEGGGTPRKWGEMRIHIFGQWVLSPRCRAVWFCVFNSYLIIANSHTSRRPICDFLVIYAFNFPIINIFAWVYT